MLRSGRIAPRSIGQRLALSFGLILLLLAGSLAAILFYLSRVNSYVDRHQRITVPAIVTASEMLQIVSRMEADVHHLLEHQERSEQLRTIAKLEDLERKLSTTLETYRSNHAARTHPVLFAMLTQHGRVDLADLEDAALASLAGGFTRLTAHHRQIEEYVQAGPRAGAPAFAPVYETVTVEMESSIEQLVEAHRLIDVEMKIEGDRLVGQARILSLLLVCLLGLLILATYLQMKRQVATPLRRLASTADRVAHHDLAAQFIPVPGHDEVARLAASLTAMLTSLREHSAALVRKTKELEAFTYSVAHDLKGPLREIEGFSSLLEKRFAEGGDAQVTHHIQVIHKSALRLSHMIDALLKYSRLGQQDLPRSRFNILEMISSLLVDRQTHATGTKPKVTVSVPFPDLYGEPISIRQAITNLLDNAVKFSRTVPVPVITIGGQQTASERIIWVRDNGIGFDADQHDRIFNLFERLHAPDDYEGTGVGLAVVKMVMERHRGRVWAESTPGKGSTFYLAFPQ